MSAGWLKSLRARFGAPHAPVAPPALDEASVQREVERMQADLQAGDFAAASARAAPLLESNPEHAGVLAHAGAALYLQGEPIQARPLLYKAAALDPADAFAHKFLLATLHLLQEDLDQPALALRAAELNARDIPILAIASAVLMHNGAFDAAAALIQKALAFEPEGLLPLRLLDVLSKRTTFARVFYENTPKIEAARRRVINRLKTRLRKEGLDTDALETLLCLLEGDGATFAEAQRLAAEAQPTGPATASYLEQLASIATTAGDVEAVVKHRDAALALAPDNLQARMGVAITRLLADQGDWRRNWQAYSDLHLLTSPELHPAHTPVWHGEPLGGKKLFVYQDQGFGDAIMTLRCVAALVRQKVNFVVWVLPSLATLVAALVGEARLVRAKTLPDPRTLGCDISVPLFGLISALKIDRNSLGQVEPLALPPAEVPSTSSVARIGLVYGGNPLRRDDWVRRLPKSTLSALAAITGVQWVNLSSDALADLGEVSQLLKMTDAMAERPDFRATGAIIAGLDGVVAIDGVIAHLALSVGQRTAVLLPSMLDFRWQMGAHLSPFWPAALCIRADGPGQWSAATRTLVATVTAWAAEQRAQ